ncbi:flagellar basal body P-ring formation chaperone FlgA [Oceanimonas sp. CHS3-5]|uniref:flagellar basal body P-ring formation chaperone FlgA n=1 Tax=Oceanimonas sp. CHS3-5 TaxID=3068186 RepID=UPI00273DE85C|nr:flagellar basal body P-ring formation chaperone FlgA [Oceanimonas sp. CHS3-5]MDP5292298.1 flagellar basal body P-ring formation chaperone FlgA [Oceanimonas sp. CHS3-5]
MLNGFFHRRPRRLHLWTWLSLAWLAVWMPPVALASVHESIRQYAEDYVRDFVVAGPRDKVEIEAASVDTRLQLTECPGMLTADIRGSGEVRRNTHVHVQCHETPGWSLFVPVRVRILKPVVTAATPIARNTLLQPAQLQMSYQDEVLLRGDVFDDIQALLGTRSKRDLRPGRPVLASQLCVVCKGDKVTIVAETGGLSIRTDGMAEEDGTFNERIRIRNSRSGRQIQGRISEAGVVRVGL